MINRIFHEHTKNYRQDIDCLRGISVLLVVAFHFIPKIIPGGFIGVDIFFVISGYLITENIITKLINNKFSLSNFYLARVRRIFPSLIVILLFVIFIGNISLFPNELSNLGKYIFAGSFFITNIVTLREIDYFNALNITKPLLHLWSLGVEEQFYIIYPILLLFLYHIFRQNLLKLLISIILILFCSIFSNLVIINESNRFYLPFTRFWEIIIGSVIAIKNQIILSNTDINKEKYIKIFTKVFTNNILNKISHYFSIVGILFIIISLLLNRDRYSYLNLRYFFPIIGACCIIISFNRQIISNYILKSKFLRFFGIISYPLYLWHWSLLSFNEIIFQNSQNSLHKVLTCILSILLSICTYLYIEYPIRFSKANRKIKHNILIILMIFCGIYGLSIYLFNCVFLTNNNISKKYINAFNEVNNNIKRQNIPCFNYIKLKIREEYIYCKYLDVKSDKTVAIIGDSHALHSYHGFKQIGKENNFNVLLLSMSGYLMPLLYTDAIIEEKFINNRKIVINKYYNTLLNDNKISEVFIISRGPVYMSGKYFSGSLYDNKFGSKVFHDSLQNTIDTLIKSNKKVFLVTEVPELPTDIINYFNRPFSPPVNTILLRNSYINYQKEYLDLIYSLNNVIIINAMDIFCDKYFCNIFDENNLPLYYDNNHLSRYGSLLLAKYIFNKYNIN
jgi:peptidoglycan/LPS O-acetylase OafA/YrhL